MDGSPAGLAGKSGSRAAAVQGASHRLPSRRLLGLRQASCRFLEAALLPGHGLAACQHRTATALAEPSAGRLVQELIASRAGWEKRQQGCRSPRCFAPPPEPQAPWTAAGFLPLSGGSPAAGTRACRLPTPNRYRVGGAVCWKARPRTDRQQGWLGKAAAGLPQSKVLCTKP